MSDWDLGFDIDIGAELHDIRGKDKNDKKEKKDTHDKNDSEAQHRAAESSKSTSNVSNQADETKNNQASDGFDVKQTQDEELGESATSTTVDNASKAKTTTTDPVGWKGFKALPGVFEHVGGSRPIALNQQIRRSQVSGVPDPLLTFIQQKLEERYTGAHIEFGWGRYNVTNRNKVFTVKSTLIRYLMFDALRDADGTHVQYAKQWLALHHPLAFSPEFDPEVNLQSNSDELDIYALLYISHDVNDGVAYGEVDDTTDRLISLHGGLHYIIDKLSQQEAVFNAYAERNHTVQTVLLLDRMGLLKGGLPRDVGDFVRILEESRSELSDAGTYVDRHIKAEEERTRTLERDQRISKRNNLR